MPAITNTQSYHACNNTHTHTILSCPITHKPVQFSSKTLSIQQGSAVVRGLTSTHPAGYYIFRAAVPFSLLELCIVLFFFMTDWWSNLTIYIVHDCLPCIRKRFGKELEKTVCQSLSLQAGTPDQSVENSGQQNPVNIFRGFQIESTVQVQQI